MDFAGVEDPLRGRFGSLGDIVSKLLPFIFVFAAMLSLLFLVWGGIRYMAARGDPKEIESAKGVITGAIIGLLVILFVAAISTVVAAVFKIDLFTFIAPTSAFAAGPTVDIGGALKMVGGASIRDAFPTVGSFFSAILRAALIIAGLVFFAMIIWGGFRYLNAGGDPKSADAARSTLTGAVIGLLIVVLSLVIIEILSGIAGIESIFS